MHRGQGKQALNEAGLRPGRGGGRRLVPAQVAGGDRFVHPVTDKPYQGAISTKVTSLIVQALEDEPDL